MPHKPAPGHFTLLYFAAAASFTRKQSEELPAPLTVADLFTSLERTYPGIREKVLESSLLTTNLEYVDVEADDAENGLGKMIQEGDEVAIIPPVSSG